MKRSNAEEQACLEKLHVQRKVVLCILLLCGFVGVALRLGYLQIVQAENLAQQAKRQQETVVAVQSPRGAIYDRVGKALALNMAVPSISADPTKVKAPRGTARKLAGILKMPSKRIEKLLRGREWVWIKRQVTHQQGRQVKALAIPGIGVELEQKRFYPNGPFLSHVLGFAGVDSQGLEGLEHKYDPFLVGKPKRVTMQRDGRGRILQEDHRHSRARSAGHTIILSVDQVVQFIVEQALEKAVAEAGAKGGTILVINPKTGGILGWALYPTFDPNKYFHAETEFFRNRAVTDPYEPGSTMKTFVAAAALQEGVVEPGTLMYGGDGEISVGGTIIHDHVKSGWVTYEHALKHSSNVVSVKIADAVGKDRLYRYLRSFGFGQRTGIDLPGESVGLFKPVKEWEPRTLPSIAIGQEIAVTPLQMVTAMAAVANHGWLMKPYVVQSIQDAGGQVIWERKPQVRGRPILEKTAFTVGRLLERAVEEGTGRRAAIPGYRVAGKTGTAQKANLNGKGYSSHVIGSFVGYVPVDDPQLTILVMIDEPKGPGWGGTVAAPVFREVGERVLRHLQIAPNVVEPITVAFAPGNT